ncbi:MAG TPA: NeuD/PglB/VioB family sugar acetyltransferase [Anaerolineaceae bacterium]|nr:NeuD/PglB/VioB family sugar acetyltransferase [Anaerolineaceae bacterium]
MPTPLPVRVPLLNPNEAEASLVALEVKEKQRVSRGDLLAVLETTKSTGELNAETDGYVAGLRARVGDVLHAGEVLCYLASSPEAEAPQPETPVDGPAVQNADVPGGLRITRPALALAQSAGLDLGRLPHGPLVTEKMVRQLLAPQEAPVETGSPEFDPGRLVIYGGGGHGKSLIDLIRALGTYRIEGVVDDGIPAEESILSVPVLGGGECLPGLVSRGVRLAVNAVGGIGNIASRIKVFERLAQAGLACPTVVHPTALVEPSAVLAAGVQIFPHAYVGSSSQVGFGAIVNTGAIVSHDCSLGEFTNISPGAMLAGAVTVGERALIGMGVTINLEVKIGAGARVGNGATVKGDVPPGGVVRAGAIWPE